MIGGGVVFSNFVVESLKIGIQSKKIKNIGSIKKIRLMGRFYWILAVSRFIGVFVSIL